MSDFGLSVLSVAFIRALVIAVGGALAYFGYRLFALGLFQKAGDFKASFGSAHVTLKAAAPGTFFGLFSAGIMIVALSHPMNIASATGAGEAPGAKSSDSTALANKKVDGAPAVSPSLASGENGTMPPEIIGPLSVQEYDSANAALEKAASGKPLTEHEQKALRKLTNFWHSWGITGWVNSDNQRAERMTR